MWSVPPTIQALLYGAARPARPGPSASIIQRGAIEGRVFHRGAVESSSPRRAHAWRRDWAALVREYLVASRARTPRRARTRIGSGTCWSVTSRTSLSRKLPGPISTSASRAGSVSARPSSPSPDEVVGYHLEQAHLYRVELRPVDDHARIWVAGVRSAERRRDEVAREE